MICLGAEPQDLFIFSSGPALAPALQTALNGDQLGSSYLNILSALLDPQINTATPETSLQPTSVQPGDPILNDAGSLAVLAPGERYRPSGCQAADCAQVYEGDQPVQMDVWTVRFNLRPGLRWSDGAPLTVDDSRYAYDLIRMLQPPAYKAYLEYTFSYSIVDVQVLEWRGIPGYTDPDPAGKFIPPLPQQFLNSLSSEEMRVDAQYAASLPVFGPYRVESWTQGVELVLSPNPNFSLKSTAPPTFDRLVYHWLEAGGAALEALQTGGCDVLDSSAIPESQYAALTDLGAAQKIRTAQEPAALEMLYFNIQPINPAQPNLLGQTGVRQAVAACTPKSRLAAAAGSWFTPADRLSMGSPVSSPAQTDDVASPEAGAALLDQAGWRDMDQNPATPRTALGVPGVTDGTPLSLRLLASPDPDRQAAALFLQQSLAACGIEIQIETQPLRDYLAAGPAGPVFGRYFSLALFAWTAPHANLPCSLFTSAQIPAPYPQGMFGWGGANAAGYASPAFDLACRNAMAGLPGSADQMEMVFQQDLPALPLYWRPRMFAARPEICGWPEAPVLSDFWTVLSNLSLENGCFQP